MGEERRGRWPGLRDQKDLLDQSCVCVIQLQREAGFVSFHALSVLSSSIGESHLSSASKPAQYSHCQCARAWGLVPRVLRKGGKNRNNVLYI